MPFSLQQSRGGGWGGRKETGNVNVVYSSMLPPIHYIIQSTHETVIKRETVTRLVHPRSVYAHFFPSYFCFYISFLACCRWFLRVPVIYWDVALCCWTSSSSLAAQKVHKETRKILIIIIITGAWFFFFLAFGGAHSFLPTWSISGLIVWFQPIFCIAFTEYRKEEKRKMWLFLLFPGKTLCCCPDGRLCNHKYVYIT
jgi:hypothetical protein